MADVAADDFEDEAIGTGDGSVTGNGTKLEYSFAGAVLGLLPEVFEALAFVAFLEASFVAFGIVVDVECSEVLVERHK